MAWSPYKEMVIGFVTRHPGCSKWDVAEYVTWSRSRNPSKQYYIVNTAIRNGWIIAFRKSNRYELYIPQPELPQGKVTFDNEGGFKITEANKRDYQQSTLFKKLRRLK